MTATEHPSESQWTPERMMQVRGVGAARVSPDGKQAVYTVTEPIMTDEKSEYRTQIWLADTETGESVQLTFGEYPSGNPRWSPDGKWIAFTGKRSDKEDVKENLYRLRVAGGEAEALTDGKSDVGEFRWSPDGSAIAFLMPDPKTEDDEKNEKGKSDWHWYEEDIKFQRLYVISVEKDADGKREPRKLTTGDYQVGGGAHPFDWSPDGKTIVFAFTKSPKADDWPTGKVSLVDLASGAVTALTDQPGAQSGPLYSPDGTQIALSITEDPPRWMFQGRLYLVPASGGAARVLTETFDEQPNLIGWSANGQNLLFGEWRGTLYAISTLHIESGKITDLSDEKSLWLEPNLNATRTHLGFNGQATDRPTEAFVSTAKTWKPVVVSEANKDFVGKPLGRTEVIHWKGAKGQEIEGLLTYPQGYADGQRVPLLLEVHGGPAGVFTQYYTGRPSLYCTGAFAERGYAVLRCNPRGSSGYGAKFRFANEKDWGGGDYEDLMAGVDFVIGLGVADPERLGVMGWSYGGYMTSWIIGHTTRFKAASIGAAVTDLVSFTGTADIPGFLPDYFGAQPWDDEAIYRAHSPLSFLANARTPSLIQHCEGDLRVPISQGYEIYNALRQQGIETRMLVMPRQDHGPREPKMLQKIMETNLEWFDKHLIFGR